MHPTQSAICINLHCIVYNPTQCNMSHTYISTIITISVIIYFTSVFYDYPLSYVYAHAILTYNSIYYIINLGTLFIQGSV